MNIYVFLLQRTITCYLWNVSKNIIQYIHKYLCVSLTAYNNLLYVECIKEYNNTFINIYVFLLQRT